MKTETPQEETLQELRDLPVKHLVIEVPQWVDQEISPNVVAQIVHGGCSSGAYMPAVTYEDALETMSDHGEEVFDYIENIMGLIPPAGDGSSWDFMAIHYLSTAVELWAFDVIKNINTKIKLLMAH